MSPSDSVVALGFRILVFAGRKKDEKAFVYSRSFQAPERGRSCRLLKLVALRCADRVFQPQVRNEHVEKHHFLVDSHRKVIENVILS